MSKKLLLSGLAIAMALPSLASATEVKVGGVVQIQQYISSDTTAQKKRIEGGDVRIAVSAEETVGDYTTYATYRLDTENTDVTDSTNNTTTFQSGNGPNLGGGLVTSDNVGVGIKGDFGDVKFGQANDVQFGEYANDIYAANPHLGSGAAWGYTGSFSGVNVGAIWSPDTNADLFGLGAEFSVGVVTLGATFGTDGTGPNSAAEQDNTIFGGKIDLGGITVAAHTWDIDHNSASTTADSDGTAVKVSGSASSWSWGITATDEDAAGGTAGDQKVTRIDLGTSWAGLGVDFRYEKTKTPTANATDWLRFQLSKSF